MFCKDTPPGVAKLNSGLKFTVSRSGEDQHFVTIDRSELPVGTSRPIPSSRRLALPGPADEQEFIFIGTRIHQSAATLFEYRTNQLEEGQYITSSRFTFRVPTDCAHFQVVSKLEN